MDHCSFLIFHFIYLQLRLHLSPAFLSTLIFPAPSQIPVFFLPNLEDVTLDQGGGQIVTFAISVRLKLNQTRQSKGPGKPASDLGADANADLRRNTLYPVPKRFHPTYAQGCSTKYNVLFSMNSLHLYFRAVHHVTIDALRLVCLCVWDPMTHAAINQLRHVLPRTQCHWIFPKLLPCLIVMWTSTDGKRAAYALTNLIGYLIGWMINCVEPIAPPTFPVYGRTRGPESGRLMSFV